MSLSLIRIGRVSSINYGQGMIRVTYPDRDDSVTAEIPVFSFTDEYKMPPIGAEVLVLHLSNGAAAGVVLGRYWNGTNTPAQSGPGVFRKEFAQAQGEAFMSYNGKTKTLTIKADKVVIDGGTRFNGSISGTEDIQAGGISLKEHTHTGAGGETTPPH